MRSQYWKLLLILVLFGQPVISQKLKKSDQLTLTNLQNHIHFLADDKLEGRRAGTKGEELAMDDINEGKQVNPETHFIINEKELNLNEDYFPFVYSPDVNIESLPAIALQEPGLP